MATIYDVAQLAGVSPKTVSRVLNRDAAVRDNTRVAVEKAMAELGYIPSSAARSMRSNRSGLIGLITGAISRAGDTSVPTGLPDMFLIQGAQKVMAAAGKTLMIADTGGDAARVEPLMRTFMQHRAEGMIYVAAFHQRVSLPAPPAHCPLVLANCFDEAGTPAVVPDDAHGQAQLVARLIAAGHRRIAYLTGGYREALAAAGIMYDEALVAAGYPDHRNRSEDLYAAIERLLMLAEPPTVLCCGNDEMALRVYGMLRSRGLRVAEDISVAGYDDHRAIAETLYPPLTSAELPYVQMGTQAAALLLELIERGQAAGSNPRKVRGALVWRDSVTQQAQ
jgi:LacI family transcriptional regulator